MLVRTVWTKVLGAIAVCPLILCILVYWFVRGLGDECLIGDKAIVEIYTRHAMGFGLTLGPYSVFGWNHPGPSCFYALAVPYFLSSGKASSLYLGALMLNGVSAAALVALLSRVHRNGEPHLAIWTMVFLGAFICSLGVDVLTSPWNPWLIVMPFLLLLFLCAGLCLGWIDLLPAVLAIGSFVVQTHVSALPTVGALVAVSLVAGSVAGLSGQGKAGDLRAKNRMWVYLSASVVAALWLPPLLEQIRDDPGNMTKLWGFFVSGADTQPVPEALNAITGRVTLVARGILEALMSPVFPGLSPLEETAVLVLQLALLPCAWFAAWKQRMPYAAALGLVTCVALLSGTWSIFHVRGRIWGYFTQWMAGIGVANLALLFGIAFEFGSRRAESRLSAGPRFSAKYSYLLALILMIFMTAWHMGSFVNPRALPPQENPAERSLSHSLSVYLKDHHTGRLLIELPPISSWYNEVALVNQLYKSGATFGLKPLGWPLLFDCSFAPDGTEKRRLIVAGPELASQSGYTVVGSQGSVFLYLSDVHK